MQREEAVMKALVVAGLLFLLSTGAGPNHEALTGLAGPPVQDESTRRNRSVIEQGKAPEGRKERSKLFSQYGVGKDLRDLARTEAGDVEIRIPPPLGGGDPHSPEPNLNELFKHITCDSDAIVIGIVTGQSSQFTDNGESIFTDYEIAVEKALKSNNAAPILTGDSITVTRPGGTVSYNGKKVRVVDSIFKPLNVNKRYLLFLRHVQSLGAYVEIPGGGSFRLSGGKLLKHTEGLSAKLSENYDATSFVIEVQLVAGNMCGGKKGGGK
jgi:hypothetical protein